MPDYKQQHLPVPFFSPKRKQITIYLTPEESEILETYCKKTGKEATAVIQALLQKLKFNH